jgi:hypothetical protein
MSTVTLANIVAFLRALFALFGATGVTTTDIAGFVQVCGAIVAMSAVIVSHIADKSEVASQ